MLKFNASAFYKASAHLHRARTAIRSNPQLGDAEMLNEAADTSLSALKELQSSLLILGAKVTSLAVHDLLVRFEKGPVKYQVYADEIGHIDATLRRELSLIQVFVLESAKGDYFEPPSPTFGTDVQAKFPSATYEIEEASKCLALDRHTAAVFHLMRTMEVGIRAVAKCLGVPDPVKGADKNWGGMLQKIKAEMEMRTRPTSTWRAVQDREFFESSYASLDAVRVAWRNTTMHVENKYTADEAEHILQAVRGFMRNVAFRLDELGRPLA